MTLGDQVTITSGTDPDTNPGGIKLIASSTLATTDTVTISSGGAIAGASVTSILNATLNNSVTTGSNDSFTSDGNIGLGTYTTVNAETNAEVNTYGAGGVGTSTAGSIVTTTHSVAVGQGTTMMAAGDVNLTPGNEPSGLYNTVMSGLSSAQSYFYGLVGVPLASATTNLISNASLTIGEDAEISSGQNVSIGAFPGTPTPTADGTAHYDGGSLSTSASSSTHEESTSSSVTDNGTITAGIYHELNIKIPSDSSSTGDSNQTIQINPDNTPYVQFANTYDSGFNAPAFINDPTITRSSGSWTSDGFTVGDGITVAGAANSANNGSFEIDSISADGLTLYLKSVSANFVTEADSSGITISDTTTSSAAVTGSPALAFAPADYTGNVAQQLSGSVSTTPVGAFVLGTLYAAGGDVAVHAGSLSGSGTITAYGGPSIVVTNDSPDYLVIAGVNIPDIPGGLVSFTGKAGAASDSSLLVDQSGASTSPTVTISENFDGSVGTNTGNYGRAVFISGPVENLGGVVNITNKSGSLGQAGTIYGEQVNISVPNGIYVVPPPASGVYFAGGNPVSEWQNAMIFPGGNPSDSSVAGSDFLGPNPDLAVSYVANAEYNDGPTTDPLGQPIAGNYTTAQSLTQAIIGTAGSQWPYNQSYVYFGDSVPYAAPGDDTSGTASNLTTLDSGGTISGTYQIGNGSNHGYFPLIPVEPLSESFTSYNSATLTGSEDSSVVARQIVIDASALDIDGQITAGQSTNWSLNLPASLTAPYQVVPGPSGQVVTGGVISYDRSAYANHNVTSPIFNIPVSTLSPGDSQITATFNALTNQIIVDNVSASSGGGAVTLDGAIISTNTLGNIHVDGGLGQVSVNNQTGIPLVVQQIYTGSNSQTTTVQSTVDITDTNQTSNPQTLYVYQPGQPIDVYQGAAGATLGTGNASSTINGTSTTYQPETGLRWQWEEQASLGRTINYNPQVGNSSFNISNWAWTSGTQSDPWQFIDPATGNVYHDPTSGLNVPVGQLALTSELFNNAGGGTFTITVNVNGTAETTTAINYNASASDLETALNNLTGVTATVTGYGKTHDPWVINGTGFSAISVTDSLKGSGAESTLTTGVSELENNATGGTFTIKATVNGNAETTSPINFNAPVGALQSALDSLTGVTATVIGEGTATDPWIISGSGFSTLSVADSLTGTGAKSTLTGEFAAFSESITGSSAHGYTWDVDYHHDGNGNTHYGFANQDGPGDLNYSASDSTYHSDDGGSDWYYEYVNSATLTLTSSVKADNPIAVDFSGLSTGNVTITSNAPVIVDGKITNPNGNTTITAQGGVTETATGSVTSNNLTLTATGGSSTVAAVPAGAVQLWNTATGGTFTLSVTVNNQIETAGPLPFNVDAPTLQSALDSLPGVEASVTGTGTAADPWLITGVTKLSTNDQGLQGGTATVAPVPSGAVQLWNTASGGTFTASVTAGGTMETTAAVNFDACASALQQALDQLTGVSVTVTGAGTALNPWVVSGLTSALSTNDSGLTFQSTLQNAPTGAIELFNDATGGAFTISAVVSGTTKVTGLLEFDTTPDEVAAALSTLLGVKVTVTGGGTAVTPWIISGTGSSSLSVNDAAAATVIQPAPVGAVELSNNANGGTFEITATDGSYVLVLGPFTYDDTASDLRTALVVATALPVVVTGNGTATDPWIISGLGPYTLSVTDTLTPAGRQSTLKAVPSGAQQMSVSGNGAFIIQMAVNGQVPSASLPANATAAQVQAALDAMGSSVQATVTGKGTTADPWLISGPGVSPISAIPFGLSGGSGTLEAVPPSAKQLSNNAGGGTFEITATVGGSAESATLSYNASAASIASALPGVTVTGLGTAAAPWLLSGATTITVNDSGLTGSSTVQSVGFLPQELWNDATGGTFTISANVNGTTETTGSLDYDASASAVDAALNVLGGVSVTVLGSGTTSDPWVIIGTGISSLYTKDSFSSGSSTTQTVPATAQDLWNTATGGDFTIQMTVASQVRTATLAHNATAAQVQAALNGMDPSVQATVTGKGTTADPWLISGTGVTAINLVPFGLLDGKSQQHAGQLNSQLLWNTATGGTFEATIVEQNGPVSSSFTTEPIAYNALPGAVATAMSKAFSANVTVTGSGTATDPWVITGLRSPLSTNDSGLAGGVLGSASQPLDAQLTSGGVLNATAGNQGVYLNLDSGAAIEHVEAGSSGGGYGDVVISATGDIVRSTSGAGGITGNNITLTSTAGGVGTQSAPIKISSNGTPQPGGGTLPGVVNVSALNDIGLEQTSGDLVVGSISSSSGNVYVDVTNGGLFDSAALTPASVLSETQIEQVWSNLQLLNLSYTTSANPTVAAFENQVDADYLQYFELLENGTVQNGVYSLNPTQASLQLFSPQTSADLEANGKDGTDPTAEDIETYAAGLYESTVAFLNANVASWQTSPDFQFSTQTASTTVGSTVVTGLNTAGLLDGMSVTGDDIPSGTTIMSIGSGQVMLSAPVEPSASGLTTNLTTLTFSGFNAAYSYTATDAQVTALTKNSVWTGQELEYAVDATGLAPIAGTPVGTSTPNISGRNVTLKASGSIGQLASPVDVTIADMQNGTLSDTQIAALLVATTPGSVLLDGTIGQGGAAVTVPFNQQPAGFVLTGVHLIQTAPLFVASSGRFNATAGTSIYLQSTAPDLNIGQVQAEGGDASITAPENIQSAGTSSPQIKTTGNLTLLAGTGDLGTPATSQTLSVPLVIDVKGTLEGAAAGQDIYLQQTGGDLNFDRLVAGGAIEVTDLAGGLYQETPDLPVVGTSFVFDVRGGVDEPAGVNGSGSAAAGLEIQLSAPAELAGIAGDSININSVGTPTAGALTLAELESPLGTIAGLTSLGGDVTLQSALSILDGINGPAGFQYDDITGNNITLTTGGTTGSTIGTAGAGLYIDSGYSAAGMLTATSNEDAYIVQTSGDLTLNQVNVTSFGTAYLTAISGSILNGISAPAQGPPTPNIVAEYADLTAGGSVGLLNTEVSYVEGSAGSSSSDSFTISNTGPAVVGGVTTNPVAVQAGGTVTIGAHSPLTITQNVISNQDIYLTGDHDPGEVSNLTIEPGVLVWSEGVFSNGVMQSGGNVFIKGGDSVYIDGNPASHPAPYDEPYDATILAANSITIQDDFTPGGPNPGNSGESLTIAIDGVVSAPQVQIDGSNGGDTFDLRGTLDGKVSLQGGSGNDAINVSPGAIQGSLNIDAGGGSDNRLIVSDSGNSTTSRNITVTSNRITGIGPGPINYSANGGSWSDPNGNDGILITSSLTEPATFDIQSTLAGSTTQIQSGGGVDTYNVGSNAPVAGGVATGIQGLLTVAGGDADTLNVDDTGDTQSAAVTLTATNIAGLSMGSQGINYGGLKFLNLHLGGGGDTLNIQSTAAGATSTLRPLAGSPNTFNIGSKAPATGGIVDNIQGSLVIEGTGADTLNVDDSGSTISKTGTLTFSTLTGLGMGSQDISFSGTSSVNLALGSGANNQLNIQSTASGVSTTVSGSSGTDTFHVGNQANNSAHDGSVLNSIQGPLAIHGSASGSDTADLDDTGDNRPAAATLTATKVTGLGMGPQGVAYSGLKFLNLYLGGGGDTLNIQSTAGGTTSTLQSLAGSQNTFNVGSNAPGMGGILDNIQGGLIIDATDADTLNVDDSGDTMPQAGTLTESTITGLGMGPGGITYRGLAVLNIDLGSGVNQFVVDVASVNDLPPTTTIDGGHSNSSTITATWSGDANATFNLAEFGRTSIQIAGNLNGTITGGPASNAAMVSIGGSVTTTGSLVAGTIGTMTVGQDIAGLVQSLGTIGSLTVGSPSYPGSVASNAIVSSVGNMGSVVVYGNVAGRVTAGNNFETPPKKSGGPQPVPVIAPANIGTVSVYGDISGTVMASEDIGSVTIGSPVSASSVGPTGLVQAGQDLNSALVYGNIAGIFQAGGTIGSLTVDGSVIPTLSVLVPGTVTAGIIRASNIGNLTVGGAMAGLTTVSGNLNTMSVGRDLAGLVNVGQTLSQLTVTGGTPGSIVAKTIGTVGVDGGYGPVVAQIEENGIERRIEAAVPASPYPMARSLYSYPTSAATLASPAGVNFEYFYEGLASNSGTLANPQLTMRVSNNSGNTSPDQYDLSLVTWSDTAQFNLARLDASANINHGVSGIRNVDVEGSLQSSMTQEAQLFFNLSTAGGGVRLPHDTLAGVEVRDNAQAGDVTAKSIQGIAFGSLRSGNTTLTGAASTPANASQLLTPGTAIVQAGTVSSQDQETFRVPFDDEKGEAVAFFLDDSKQGILDSNSVEFVNEANNVFTGAPRGTVTAVVTVNGPSPSSISSSFIQSVALAGDGGSFSTAQPILSRITSTGPLGDLTLQSTRGLIADVTAPSIVGSVYANGPITGTIQTTGVWTNMTTGQTSAIPADFGRVDAAGGEIYGITTVTSAPGAGISGQIISRGNLISQIDSGGAMSGVIASQGGIGGIQLGAAGKFVRYGGIQSNGSLTGQVVALGNIFGDISVSGNLTGRIAANGRSSPLLGATGILGNINVGGSIGSTSTNAAIVSRGEIGDSTLGTAVRLTSHGAIYGILAAEGPITLVSPGSLSSSHIFTNVPDSPGNPNAAAIDAIFESQNGQPITSFDSSTPGDLANLEKLLSDLAQLQVEKDKSGQNVLSD